MFTRCPACETTFRLGANDLRRAQGRVRCGECSTVFNALAYLAEEPEAAAQPEHWLPEPANDPLSPDEGSAPSAATSAAPASPEDVGVVIDIGLSDFPEADEDPFETAIFRPEPDDDDTVEFLLPPDIDAELEEEVSGVERWSHALQQHELAESGLELTRARNSDYLSEAELDEAAGEDEALTVSQPIMQPEPATSLTPVDEDFDDTIWERIPGVGATDDSNGRPIDITPLRSPWVEEPPVPVNKPADAEENELLEFNAPEETWSRIFVSGQNAAPDDDDGYPELYSNDSAAGDEEHIDEDGDRQPPTHQNDADDSGDVAQLERIFNPERIAAAMQERMATRSGAAALSSPGQPDGTDIAAASADDDPERLDAMAVWLTDETAEAESEEDTQADQDEFPAEGYDVQHIILADESEALPAQSGSTPRAATAEAVAPPLWRKAEEPARGRSGMWLTGGLLLVAALALQLLHYNRDTLAANPVWGAAVMNLYALAGMDLYPAWSMDDYEIRSAEAVTGESGPDIMDIRALVAVVGNQPTGYPHLRVVLSDRWSKPVAEKTFGPADYIADESSDGRNLLEPGQTLDAHVSIVDPGAGAQGFELELCLPRRHTGMECTGQPFK